MAILQMQLFSRRPTCSMHCCCSDRATVSKPQVLGHQTRTKQIFCRTVQNGKKYMYAQHHIQGFKDQHLDQAEDKSHSYNQQCEKNEMVLGRAYQAPQRRPMDLACHHLDYDKKRRQERPAERWRDNLDKYWRDAN